MVARHLGGVTPVGSQIPPFEPQIAPLGIVLFDELDGRPGRAERARVRTAASRPHAYWRAWPFVLQN